ncbi:MAG: PQQ-binding-like beta-propeller repeat protein [Planctomycetaceae bacterium]|jgi:hypothetical protein|nr:PQQ-binding-like beta-propeller repeat protein [Planctomycetaceae bacterium]
MKSRNRKLGNLFAILFAVIIVTIIFLPLVEGSQLLSPRQMERFGLVRVWYNQLAVNNSDVKLQYITIEGDSLFAITSDAKIHVLDSATGKLRWSKVIGKRELQYFTPAANSRVVAVVNNIELFVFDRKNGKLLFYTPLPNSVAVTACEISENYVYIPMQGGRIIVYPLEEGIMEQVFNMETGQYEDANPVISKPPVPDNQSNQLDHVKGDDSKKTKSKVASMQVEVPNDLASRDETIANLVESFAETKYSILAKPEKQPEEPQFVLRPPLNFPMSTISFGELIIQPKISSQIIKINPIDNSLGMHWEILTWVNKDGDFHASIIRNLSQTKIEQLYRVNSPTKIFKPENNNIAERDWKIDKQIVIRPTTNQTVPYFYSGINFDRQMIPDLSILGTKSGYIFAIKNRNGEIAWHFIGNGAVIEQIGIVGIDVYAPTIHGMYNINILTGKEKWYVPNISKFICASKSRVYVQNKQQLLVILDRKNGSKIASIDLRKFKDILFNIETDRLFIVDNSGLIQCFAERQTDTVSNNIRFGVRSIPEIRHRLSAAQYAETIRGNDIPDLYWVTSLGLNGKRTNKDSINTDKTTPENSDVNNIDINSNKNTTETDSTETNSTETNSTETNTTETNSTETDPTETDITETNSTETDPTETDATETDNTDQPLDITPESDTSTSELPLLSDKH